MPATQIENIAALSGYLGMEVGVSEWLEVTQERINRFAEATDDHQWIHVDPARAAQESPFGTTIAHGFLTLSLLIELGRTALCIGNMRIAINYGLNRVRFVAPVPAGTRLRGRFALSVLEEVRGGVQATWNVTVEREGGQKPCCTAEWVVRYCE